ncbi:MAG: hypothetical protein QXZ48_02810 [Zestosphaera sp.]
MSDSKFREITPENKHGIYKYLRGEDTWVYLNIEGIDPFIPRDKYAVMYFDNAKCHACRRYDIYWFPFVRSLSSESNEFSFYIVLCNWFARDCESLVASATFTYFDVHSSPTTLLLSWIDGKVAYKEKYDGVLSDIDLKNIVPSFPERVSKFLKGEPVKPPLSKEDTIISLLSKLLKGKESAES